MKKKDTKTIDLPQDIQKEIEAQVQSYKNFLETEEEIGWIDKLGAASLAEEPW